MFTEGRSSSFLPGFGIFSFRAVSAAVRGISCIRPTAPAGERTSAWKRDSWRMTARRTSGSIPERLRSQSARNSGARGYWILSTRPGCIGSRGTFDVSLIPPFRSPARYRKRPGAPPSPIPIAFRAAVRSISEASRTA